MGIFPKAPDSKSTADYVVTVFVVTVATLLMIFAIGILIAATLGRVVEPYVNMLMDMVTTIVGALIGFIAGKGAGKDEAHEEHAAAAERQLDREAGMQR